MDITSLMTLHEATGPARLKGSSNDCSTIRISKVNRGDPAGPEAAWSARNEWRYRPKTAS